MEHKSVDRIMTQVERYYRGEFSVNGDRQYSQRVAKRYQERSKKHFNGRNGKFDLDRMLWTEGCTRKGDVLQVPAGGVVYGPYFTFAQGNYCACFEISGDLHECKLEVFSARCGVIASAELSEKEKSEKILLEFALSKELNDLELKVLNRGKGVIYFKGVTVKNRFEVSAGMQKVSIGVGRTEQEDFAAALEEIGALQIKLAMESKKTGGMAECELPADSRLRGIKKLIRKVINCFALFQVVFNKRITGCFAMAVQELQLIVEAIQQMVFEAGSLKVKIEELAEQIETQRQQLETRERQHTFERTEDQRLIQKLEECMVRTEAENIEIRKQLADLSQHHEEWAWQMQQINQIRQSVAEEREAGKERFDERIAELKEILNQQTVRGEDNHTEISHIWSKIREIDQEFRTVWQNNRDMNSNLDSVWSTYQAFRREVFYEISSYNHGERQLLEKSKETPIVKSTANAKIKQSGGRIRLNLGSGSKEIDGYLSVDVRELPEVDVVADVAALPYEKETVDEILSAHLIEHFTAMVMERELLPYWYALLKSGGVFRVIFPDLDGMIQAYTGNEVSFETLAEVIMGGQDYRLDYHYAVYSPERVAEMLKRVGFRDIEIVARNRENGKCREAEIVARK